MKVKLPSMTEIETDINFPSYYKYEDGFNKYHVMLISETEGVFVSNDIEYKNYLYPEKLAKIVAGKELTEYQFRTRFQEVVANFFGIAFTGEKR